MKNLRNCMRSKYFTFLFFHIFRGIFEKIGSETFILLSILLLVLFPKGKMKECLLRQIKNAKIKNSMI